MVSSGYKKGSSASRPTSSPSALLSPPSPSRIPTSTMLGKQHVSLLSSAIAVAVAALLWITQASAVVESVGEACELISIVISCKLTQSTSLRLVSCRHVGFQYGDLPPSSQKLTTAPRSNCSTQSIRIKGDTLGKIGIDVRCLSFYSYGPKGHACRATDGTCKQCDSVDHGQICLHNGPYCEARRVIVAGYARHWLISSLTPAHENRLLLPLSKGEDFCRSRSRRDAFALSSPPCIRARPQLTFSALSLYQISESAT